MIEKIMINDSNINDLKCPVCNNPVCIGEREIKCAYCCYGVMTVEAHRKLVEAVELQGLLNWAKSVKELVVIQRCLGQAVNCIVKSSETGEKVEACSLIDVLKRAQRSVLECSENWY